MRIPDAILDAIRAKLPVSRIVGRHVKLRRSGRELVGLSPFKAEKTPSFAVNDAKGFYHCFASGEHGDIFAFLMAVEGLDFREAVERLASEAGIPLPKSAPESAEREETGTRLRTLMETACVFFQAALASETGSPARAYLERRGVTAAEIRDFRLGHAPAGRHALKEHLATKGFTPEEMAASGMVVTGEDIPVSYDRFRGRLMFPITDLRGQVIAFGGRALEAGQQPKYLNSPETPLFHKGAVLFNAASARKAAHERGSVIVAEGYMDVIALARAGFPNAVAPLGTALTAEQIGMLWRMAPEPIVCFDGDSAGMKAATRAVETALPLLKPGQSLAFAVLPDGLDPDDLLRQRGALAVSQALAGAKPLVDMLWDKELAAAPCDTPERRAGLEQRLRDRIDTIADRGVRGHYHAAIQKRLREAFAPRRAASAPFTPQHPSGRYGGPGARRGAASRALPRASVPLDGNALLRTGQDAMPRTEARLLRLLLDHPWLLDDHVEEISAIALTSPAARDLRDRVVALGCEHGGLDREGLHRELSAAGALARLGPVLAGDAVAGINAPREEVLELWRHALAMHRRAVDLPRELEAASKALAAAFTEENFASVQSLYRQMHGGA